MLAAQRAQLFTCEARGPRRLVGAGGRQRVVDVAHSADAARQRDLLAGQPVRVAGAVPVLVMRTSDDLTELDDRRARSGEQVAADVRVALHLRALLGIELIRLAQDV